MPGFVADLQRHAADIAATLPVPADYPARGRAWPKANLMTPLRKAGWPVETVTASVPQREHRGPRAGQRTREAPQPVSVVPLSWMTELARRMGCGAADLCRGLIADE